MLEAEPYSEPEGEWARQADKKQTAHARCATKVVWPVTYILRGADAQIANSSPTHAGLPCSHRE